MADRTNLFDNSSFISNNAESITAQAQAQDKRFMAQKEQSIPQFQGYQELQGEARAQAHNSPDRPQIHIVDMSYVAHRYSHVEAVMTAQVPVIDPATGIKRLQDIPTKIQNFALKFLRDVSRGGQEYLGVVFDKPIPSRRGYLYKMYPTPADQESARYKAGRTTNRALINDSEMVRGMLTQAGIPTYTVQDFESDDLFVPLIEACRERLPGVHINLYTNDVDILPLVAEDVSVWIYNRNVQFSEFSERTISSHFEVTPRTYSEYVSNLYQHRKAGITLPYNLVLLDKILCGDSSDNIPAISPRRASTNKRKVEFYQKLEEQHKAGLLDLTTLFTYNGDVNAMYTHLADYLLDDVVKTRLQEVFTAQGIPIYIANPTWCATNPDGSLSAVALFDECFNPHQQVLELLHGDPATEAYLLPSTYKKRLTKAGILSAPLFPPLGNATTQPANPASPLGNATDSTASPSDPNQQTPLSVFDPSILVGISEFPSCTVAMASALGLKDSDPSKFRGVGDDYLGGLLQLGRAFKNYTVMNLNGDLGGSRQPIHHSLIKNVPQMFSLESLQQQASFLRINLMR